MRISEKVRKALVRYRGWKGYSQEYVAFRLGISARQYQRLETGTAPITLERVEELCVILGLSVEDLLSRKSDPELDLS